MERFIVTATVNGEVISTAPLDWMQLADVLNDAKKGVMDGSTENVTVKEVKA